MPDPFVQSIAAQGLLSFGPKAEAIALTNLNVIIGPNGSGKSNLIELFALLKLTPTDLAGAVREGGGIEEWLWKGSGNVPAQLDTVITVPGRPPTLMYYRLAFGLDNHRIEILNETFNSQSRVFYSYGEKGYYITERQGKRRIQRLTTPDRIDPQQSILSQRKDPDRYPELTAVGTAIGRIQVFREWSFGRTSTLRRSQPADLPNDILLPDGANLGLILNRIERTDAWPKFNEYLRRFLPRFERLSTGVQGGTVQVFLHELGLGTPIVAARLSDGTLRFIALLAILLNPTPAPLVCIEEPGLGLHMR